MPDNDIHESTQQLIQDWSDPTPPAAEEIKNPAGFDVEPDIETSAVATVADIEPVTEIEIVKQPGKLLSPELTATIALASFDGLQTLCFSSVAKRKLKKRFPGHYHVMMQLMEAVAEKQKKVSDLTEEEQKIYFKAKTVWQSLQDIPFSDDEYKKIEEPLAQIIAEAGYQMPPGLGLGLAVVQVMLPRMTDALMD